jgi:nucleosome binding factor SPN SPT16 subunit
MERVDFALRNFDMVFIFKDYERPVSHINAVPMKSLAAIKDWLDSCDIKFTEKAGPNLEWKKIMKTILEDPEEFFETGGWNFLEPEEAGTDEEEEEESEFEVSEDELDEEDSDSEEYDSDASATDSGSDSGSGSGSDEDGSEEEPGLDWDAMEAQAKNEDARKNFNRPDEEEQDRGKKRKGGASSGKSTFKPSKKSKGK